MVTKKVKQEWRLITTVVLVMEDNSQFLARPHPGPRPPGRGDSGRMLLLFDCLSTTSRLRNLKVTEQDSPSPWGEGRVEGGCKISFLPSSYADAGDKGGIFVLQHIKPASPCAQTL